jgi:hypothetical protein
MNHRRTRRFRIFAEAKRPHAVALLISAALSLTTWDWTASRGAVQASASNDQAVHVGTPVAPSDAYGYVKARWQDDAEAMRTFRPGYAFWKNIFTIPDGSIAFGSAVDGHLLAVFPARGSWAEGDTVRDPALAGVLDGVELPRALDDRRDVVAQRLEGAAGPILHNPTRGLFVEPNARRYGAFLGEWGAIYERFAVPAEIGLAQAMLESGFSGDRRSSAGAIGLCQWLKTNWKVLDKISSAVIEAQNQTTQASYCAAYLTVLATKYQSFIPALSEHHSGGTNVGRAVINGERLGGTSAREQYLLGSQFAHDLRTLDVDRYRDLYRSYGPRSYLYAEMTFGNGERIQELTGATRQSRIYAMRTTRAVPITEIRRRTQLSEDEIRRFNPALKKKVPAGATIYLPRYVEELGRDVAFWHRSANATFVSVLNDFVRLDRAVAEWENPAFEPVLRAFQRRFAVTQTEEGAVMATALGYAIQEAYASTRSDILAEFRNSEQIRQLFDVAVRERDALRMARTTQP